MNYIKAKFVITPNTETARDVLAALAGEAGFETFEETEEGIDGYVQEQVLTSLLKPYKPSPMDRNINSFNLRLQDLKSQVSNHLTPLASLVPGTTVSFTLEATEQKDWNEAWEKEGFEPIVVSSYEGESRTIVIHDGRHLPAQQDMSQAISICINARMAFGTGTHATTQMIVARLLTMPLAGLRVLDCGCGTGILGIAAAKLGAREVVGYDIDQWSVDNTRHNAQLNDVTCIETLHGDAQVLPHVSGLFDVVLANINRNILLADMPLFKEVMATGATLIMSGFYDADVTLLVDQASRLGMEYIDKYARDDWRCIVVRN